MSVCPINQSLNAHLSGEEQAQLRTEAIEEKSEEVRETLCDGNNVDVCGTIYNIDDFTSDFEINDRKFIALLIGSEEEFVEDASTQLDVFCTKLATEIIDNMEPEDDRY